MSDIKINPPIQTPKKRVDSIDAFRGFTIFAMIFVIQVAGYKFLPLTFPHFNSAPVSTFKHAGEDGESEEWAFWEGSDVSKIYTKAKVTEKISNSIYNVEIEYKNSNVKKTFKSVRVVHAKPLNPGEEIIMIKKNPDAPPEFRGIGNGCTFTDLVAPFFVFIVGICIPLSKKGRGAGWWKHAGFRTLGLIIAGIIYISLVLKASYWWGILQAIGIAYFMGAAALQLPVWGRWILAVAVAFVHGFMTWHFPWWVELGDKGRPFLTILAPDGDPLRPLTVHCTPWGSISYGLITVVGTIIGESVVTKDPKKIIRHCLLVGLVFTIGGYVLHIYQAPINKDFVSPAYSVFTSGIGALTFLLFYLVMDVLGIKKWAYVFNEYGKNALLAYFMQPIVRIFISALGFYEFFKGCSGWYGMYAGFLWTMLLWCVVLWCNKKEIFWKL